MKNTLKLYYLHRKKGFKKKMSLIEAVKDNNIESVQTIIAGGGDLNSVDEYGRTALIWAADEGFVECVKILLEANADVNKADDDGWTSLIWASSRAHVECVKVAVFSLCVGEMKIFLCSHVLFLLQLLIAHGANINAASHYGYSPISASRVMI